MLVSAGADSSWCSAGQGSTCGFSAQCSGCPCCTGSSLHQQFSLLVFKIHRILGLFIHILHWMLSYSWGQRSVFSWLNLRFNDITISQDPDFLLHTLVTTLLGPTAWVIRKGTGKIWCHPVWESSLNVLSFRIPTQSWALSRSPSPRAQTRMARLQDAQRRSD